MCPGTLLRWTLAWAAPRPAGRDSVGFPARQEVKPHGGISTLAPDAPRREQAEVVGQQQLSGPAPITVTAVLGPVSDPQHTLF